MTRADGPIGTPGTGPDGALADRGSESGPAFGPADENAAPGRAFTAPGDSARVGSVHVGSALDFDDPLDRPSPDDSDRGWGGTFTSSADDDFTRFLNEKPPHHL